MNITDPSSLIDRWYKMAVSEIMDDELPFLSKKHHKLYYSSKKERQELFSDTGTLVNSLKKLDSSDPQLRSICQSIFKEISRHSLNEDKMLAKWTARFTRESGKEGFIGAYAPLKQLFDVLIKTSKRHEKQDVDVLSTLKFLDKSILKYIEKALPKNESLDQGLSKLPRLVQVALFSYLNIRDLGRLFKTSKNLNNQIRERFATLLNKETINLRSFNNIEKLYDILDEEMIKVKCLNFSHRDPNIHSKLSKSLAEFNWDRCPYVEKFVAQNLEFPNLKFLKIIGPTLQFLDLESCHFSKDYGGYDLKGLKYCTQLKSLNLRNVLNTQNLNFLTKSNSQKLTSLNISNCTNLKDLKGLENCNSLKCLKMSLNQATDEEMELIGSLPIEELDISNCSNFLNFSWLKNFPKLKKLNLSNTKMKDLEVLSYLSFLEAINLTLCKDIRNPNVLQGCTNLKHVHLYNATFYDQRDKTDLKDFAKNNNIQMKDTWNN